MRGLVESMVKTANVPMQAQVGWVVDINYHPLLVCRGPFHEGPFLCVHWTSDPSTKEVQFEKLEAKYEPSE